MAPSRESQEFVFYMRVVSGNRITLPGDVREELGIKKGDYVRMELDPTEGKLLVSRAH